VIVEETKPYVSLEQQNIVLAGPEIRLSPAGALAMGMVIHELATNAVKHGALSGSEGKVAIDWRIEGGAERQLVVEWTESGGPVVERPFRRGFGLVLIERSFSHELSGSASVAFEPGGVRATLRAPTREAVAEEYRYA
jgi:two-component sensor histidine kinase